MRIAHLALSCFYLDDMLYQENALVRAHVEAGHEVEVLASTLVLGPDRRVTYGTAGKYMGSDGAMVTRVPYRRIGPAALQQKIRAYRGVRQFLDRFAPDLIVFHGVTAWEIRTAAKFVRDHPNTELRFDAHEHASNSGQTFVSRRVLHEGFYGPVLRSAIASDQEILCISTEVQDYVADVYRIDRQNLTFFPLGGFLPDDDEYEERRARFRLKHGISSDRLVIAQVGKMEPRKRLFDGLDAFSSNPDLEADLLIGGSFTDDIRDAAMERIDADDRIRFVGWLNSEDVLDLLCGIDIYLQPGSQSATMQQALCCRCAVIIADTSAHLPFIDGNGWLVGSQDDVRRVLQDLERDGSNLAVMKSNSQRVAKALLDYRRMAEELVDTGSVSSMRTKL